MKLSEVLAILVVLLLEAAAAEQPLLLLVVQFPAETVCSRHSSCAVQPNTLNGEVMS